MNKERILIVDDEDRIREMVKEYLSIEQFIIDETGDGKEALELFRDNNYSLVILDIMMPGLDGWTVCREIRKTSRVSIIMLTARGEEYDKLFGFELGVDDYVVKPFSPKELLARIKAVIRRSLSFSGQGIPQSIIEYEGLSIDIDAREVTVDGERINLTPKEYELLKFLAQNTHKVFSREQLLDKVWGYDFFGDYRTVDTHIKMLRESLKGYRKFIVTAWGIGYKFDTGGTK